MNETGQSGVVADDHTPPPSDLTFREALEQLRVLWHGHEIGVSIVNQAPEAGVDTPEDLARVQARWHEMNA